jgi:DNA-binding transcriptional ArsR family regulator
MIRCVIRTKAPALLPLFRSRLQAALLARLFLVADEGETLAELARQLDADPASVQREVDRLEGAGLLTSRRVGNTRIVRADPDSPVHGELAALLAKAFGPAPLLEAALARLGGIQHAFIFGSWARRFHGEPGPLPRDVDVLIVGEVDPDDLYRAAEEVEGALGVEVNPILVGPEDWEHPSGVVARVREQPVVELSIDADDH